MPPLLLELLQGLALRQSRPARPSGLPAGLPPLQAWMLPLLAPPQALRRRAVT